MEHLGEIICTRLTNAQLFELLAHQETYKDYTNVMDPDARSCLVEIARLFTDLDEFFAAMFVHIMLASDASELSEELGRIRYEIASRQATNSSQGRNQGGIYLGDLGHYCEALLKEYRQAKHNLDDATSLPEFTPTHSDEQSWIDYLEDGFEIPYWKLMLDAFATSRLKKSTLGGKAIATTLISMRSDIVELYRTLQRVLECNPGHEDIEGITSVIDKRITILRGFTDRVAMDKHSRDHKFKTDVKTNDDNTGASNARHGGNQVRHSHWNLVVRQLPLTLPCSLQRPTLSYW